jgi:ABC-type transporter Mla subunit MlaD
MASLKDAEQLTKSLDDVVERLRAELGRGGADFERLTALADELGEQADGLAETFNNLNETLMQRLGQSNGGRAGASSRAKSQAKTAVRS